LQLLHELAVLLLPLFFLLLNALALLPAFLQLFLAFLKLLVQLAFGLLLDQSSFSSCLVYLCILLGQLLLQLLNLLLGCLKFVRS
jgi:hypothetical protein